MTNYIGLSVPREEAWSKVTGSAVYTSDLKLPGCLEAKVLRSPYPYARILKIDTSQAKKLQGVRAVITAQDLPNKPFGNGIQDQPVFARERVRFVGERVAAVAADDIDIALEALSLIQVEYEELPSITDPLEAMIPGATLLHPELNTYRKDNKVSDIPNVVDHVIYGIGDLEVGFAKAELIYEHTFRTQVVHSGYLEPHVCMVEVGSDKAVKVWSNNKAPFELRDKLAKLISLPFSKVEVIYGNIGGDFGGKGAIMDEPICYYLALATQKPVRLAMTVEEELFAANPRHATMITVKSGMLKDGTLVARHAEVISDAGAYAGANSNPIVGGIRRALGAYRIPHARIDGYAVYTNTVPAGHCRAPGDPQVYFAVESHTDLLAHAIGMDPLEFRRRNVLLPGDTSPTGLKWEGINALQVLEMAADKVNWDKRQKLTNVGYGIALTERPTGLGGSAAAVMLHADGSATVVSGFTDPGTGSSTVLRQIVANELEMSLTQVSITGGSTAMVPFDNGSGSSRVTHLTGHSVRLAAQDALNQAKQLAASQFMVAEDQVSYRSGLFLAPDKDGMSLLEVFAKAGKAKNVIIGRGSFIAEKSKSSCFNAQVAEVEVDTETGHVNVRRVLAVNDIGKALNPLAVKSQVEGAVIQGLGFAMNEELPHSKGHPIVRGLANYKIATCLDAPPVDSYLLEEDLGPGPYGAKAIGEHGIAATAPAIANAIYDAIGVRILDLPITPEKILQALAVKREEEGDRNEV